MLLQGWVVGGIYNHVNSFKCRNVCTYIEAGVYSVMYPHAGVLHALLSNNKLPFNIE